MTHADYTIKVGGVKVRIWTSFHVDPDDLKDLENVSENLGLSRSQVARRALRTRLREILRRGSGFVGSGLHVLFFHGPNRLENMVKVRLHYTGREFQFELTGNLWAYALTLAFLVFIVFHLFS